MKLETLRQMFDEGPLHTVYAETLGEEILLASDTAEIPNDNKLVVYRWAELKKLKGSISDHLEKVHLTKKMFDGEVSEPDSGPRIYIET